MARASASVGAAASFGESTGASAGQSMPELRVERVHAVLGVRPVDVVAEVDDVLSGSSAQKPWPSPSAR